LFRWIEDYVNRCFEEGRIVYALEGGYVDFERRYLEEWHDRTLYSHRALDEFLNTDPEVTMTFEDFWKEDDECEWCD